MVDHQSLHSRARDSEQAANRSTPGSTGDEMSTGNIYDIRNPPVTPSLPPAQNGNRAIACYTSTLKEDEADEESIVGLAKTHLQRSVNRVPPGCH